MEWTKRKAQCKEWQLFEAGTHIPCPVVTLFGQGIVEGTDSGCNQCGAPNGSLHQPVPVVCAKPEVKYEVYVTNQHPDGEHVDKVFPGTTPTTTVVAHAMQLDKLIKGQRQSQGFKVHARRVTTEEVWTS